MSIALFTAPNWTQVPNLLLDEKMSQVSPAEFKCIMLITRKTVGFHRQMARISLKEFTIKCGLSKQGVLNSINNLLEKGFIKKTKQDGYEEANQYGLNVLYPENSDDVNSIDPIKKHPVNSVAQRVNQVDGRGVKEVATIKEKKKRKDKEIIHNAQSPAKPTHEPKNDDFFFDQNLKDFVGISEKDMADWKEIYKHIDVRSEILKAKQWVIANPSKKKKLWRKFLTTWLNKANDCAENKKAYRQNTFQLDGNDSFVDWMDNFYKEVREYVSKDWIFEYNFEKKYILYGGSIRPRTIDWSRQKLDENIIKNDLQKYLNYLKSMKKNS